MKTLCSGHASGSPAGVGTAGGSPVGVCLLVDYLLDRECK